MADKPGGDSKIPPTPTSTDVPHPIGTTVNAVDHHETMQGQARQLEQSRVNYIAGGILPTIEAPNPGNKDNRAGNPGSEGAKLRPNSILPQFDPIELTGSKAPGGEGPTIKPLIELGFKPDLPKWNPTGTQPLDGEPGLKPTSPRWKPDPKWDPIAGPLDGPLRNPLDNPTIKPLIERPFGRPLVGPLENPPGRQPEDPLGGPLDGPTIKPLIERPLGGPLGRPLEDPRKEPLSGPLEGPTIKPLIEPAIKIPPGFRIPSRERPLPPFEKTPNWPESVDPKQLIFDDK